MANKVTVQPWEDNPNKRLLDEMLKGIPPMIDEPNQAEIDAETTRRLHVAATERKEAEAKASEVIKRYLGV